MSTSINTNLASMTAQRNSNRTQNDLSTAISRLSSGLRINSAKDDAAGLAIADRFTSQIRGLTQAARNANDGISLAQTAEGSLASVSDNLQRIRELAVQSANATNSSSDRASLQLEVGQLVSEINRVATQTSFNGTNLLDGTFSNKVFQVGANAGQTISVNAIGSARASDLGASYTASVTGGSSVGATALAAGGLTINNAVIQVPTAGAGAGQTANSAFALAQAINASQGTVTASAVATSYTGGAPSAGALASGLSINGVTVGAITAGTDAATQGANVAAAINLVSAASGVTASANASTGVVTLAAADGRNIDVGASAGATTATGLAQQVNYGSVKLSSNSTTAQSIVVAGTSAGLTASGLSAGTTASAITGTSLSNIDISTVAGANTALASVDSALSSVSSSRASLGAIQNRFSSTIENLQTTNENLSASRSRIQDADFAQETANLSRAQVLQQAGTAMVAQANQLPQQILTLLR